MPIEVLMPKLGLTMTEGTIQRWLVSEGQPVRAGQILFEVETEKAVTEIEAQASGVLGRIVAQEGETIPIGRPIGYLLAAGETVADIPTATPPTSAAAAVAQAAVRGQPHAPAVEAKASPIARRLAKELGVDLAALTGSGPGGRIIEDDVRLAAQNRQATVETPDGVTVPLRGVRRLIAERMSASLREAAQLTLMREVDATELVDLRQRLNLDRQADALYTVNDFLIYIVAGALREHAALNTRLEGDVIRQMAAVNIGLAVETERGLLVPVVRAADEKTLDQISRERGRLLDAIQHNRLGPDDLSGSTFSISNLGAFGVDAFTPILNPPECGLLGVGRIVPRPVVYGEQEAVVIRRMLTLSLSFDHRLVDGAPAARFLARVAAMIELPDVR
jgi:pyruvate dehydrogenase E2 component (dihydrolipoamide acetyltransferase)